MSEIADIEELQHLVRAGQRPKLVSFWGHTPSHPDEVGAECLSQWYPAPFEIDGVRYDTAEHFMMAGKARLFGDRDVEEAILRAPQPSEAKDLGRAVRGFDEARWTAARVDLVIEGNLAKFRQHPALRDFLL